MSDLSLTFTRLAGSSRSARLLVVAPSLGTSVELLWARTAGLFAADTEVLGWDLPGHGRSLPARRPFSVAELADAVHAQTALAAADRPTSFAGVSLGGAVALQLALGAGGLDEIFCIAAAAQVGTPQLWAERAELVRRAGTGVMVPRSAERWFAQGFVDREPATVEGLLRALSDTDRESYALACEALAGFDVREVLGGVTSPLTLVAGAHDVVVPVDRVKETAAAAGATFVVLPECGHLPPAESPAAVAALLHVAPVSARARGSREQTDAGAASG